MVFVAGWPQSDWVGLDHISRSQGLLDNLLRYTDEADEPIAEVFWTLPTPEVRAPL
jgi:hypothetical protein